MNSKERIDASREIYSNRVVYNGRTLEEVGYEGVLKKYLNKEIQRTDMFDAEVRILGVGKHGLV